MKIPDDFPERLIEKLRQLYSPIQVKTILKGFEKPRHTTLRVNTLKTSLENFNQQASKQHIKLEASKWYDLAFILESPPLRALSETALYKEGWCYVQSFSSMIPAIVLDPQPDEHVLDLAAAPGSKTTQMAMLMNNSGQIVANDSSQIRLYKLEANLKQQGVTNVTIRRGVGQTLWQDYPNYFDKVLVDVPCSMEGRISFDEPKSYQHWSRAKIKELVGIQRFLLKSALSACKPGGTIVYSTCTLAAEENESVIDWILRKSPEQIALEDFELDNVPTNPGFTTMNDRQLSPDLVKTKRILPDQEFEGFYIAKLKKTSN